ncbi:MAG: hypothetical protein EG824_12215, partial [Deltaproteobacteria bacterium]|nr:hypothetical protein [Deltaproteobacteria bacterium]
DPYNLQAYNRYAYVWNNPLNSTDPSGYFNLGHAISQAWKSVWHSSAGRTVMAIVAAAYLGPGGSGALFTAGETMTATAAALANTAVAGFASGTIMSGSLQGGLQGAVSASLFYGVGDLTDFHGATGKDFLTPKHLANIAGHAAVGCAMASAQGGSCRSGALAAGFGSVFTPIVPSGTAGLVITSVVGGTASVLGGGRFANGAVTSAFGYLFNQSAGYDPNATGDDYYSTRPVNGQGMVMTSNQTLVTLAGGTAAGVGLGALAVPVSAEGFSLTTLLSYGEIQTARGAGQGLLDVAMTGRNAAQDFAALAKNYGAEIQTQVNRAGQTMQRFNVGEATVTLRNFSKTAVDWTIQVTNKTVDGIKIRY